MTLRPLGALVLAVAVAASTGGCTVEADRTADVKNDTSSVVVIEKIGSDNSAHEVLRLPPGGVGVIPTTGTPCEDHANYRASFADGQLIEWRQHLCVTDTWTLSSPTPSPTG